MKQYLSILFVAFALLAFGSQQARANDYIEHNGKTYNALGAEVK